MGAKNLNKNIFVEAGLNFIGKKIKNGISTITCSVITLTNNKIKYIIKIIMYLGNRRILLKGTTAKTTC